jgi:hypothetical protein
VRWLCLGLLLAGCKTSEVRQWEARRDELTAQKAELKRLASSRGAGFEAMQANVERMRSALDLVEFVRAKGLAVRVFNEAQAQRVSFSGPVSACRDVLVGLRERRWLLSEWRLRLEGDRCDWEGETSPASEQLAAALVEPVRTRWVPPPGELLSRGLAPTKDDVARLDVEVRELEHLLGPLPVTAALDRRLNALAPLEAKLKQVDPPCDEAIVERELALDEAERGELLEVTNTKLVHPLEPRSDFRLRGLVEVVAGQLAWKCPKD